MATSEFVRWLKDSNIVSTGDCVYIVSDMMELAISEKQKGDKLNLNEIIDGMQGLVGETGTLLFPTFNWDFCKGVTFDYKKSPVRTGALPKAALARQDFTRTEHPLYSFAVWGAKTVELLGIRVPDSFGPGTIFEKMQEWNAVVLVIGLTPLAGVTYIHHVEQMVGVPYRYNKEFTAEYIDAAGLKETRSYRMYVRDLQRNPKHINGFLPLAKQMISDGLIREFQYENVPCYYLQIADLDAAVRNDILNNDSRRMYHYEGQKPPVATEQN